MFSDWMIDSTYNKKKDGTKFKYTLIGAFIFHAVAFGAIIVVPLMTAQTLPTITITTAFLAATPPPPPPPPPPAKKKVNKEAEQKKAEEGQTKEIKAEGWAMPLEVPEESA